MDINTILSIYKNELAQANEQRILLQALCEEDKLKIKQLEEEIKQLKQKGEEE